MLGRVQAADELETYALTRRDHLRTRHIGFPGNKRAAVTRRVARYMHAFSVIRSSAACLGPSWISRLTDFAHILRWALKLRAPVPVTNEELDEWAQALDEGLDPFERRRAGALLGELCTGAERSGVDIVDARHGFRRRLTETPGVVATVGAGEHVDASIYVRAIRHPVKPITEANFTRLRKDWVTPDGEQSITAEGESLNRAADVWRHAQEMALGLYYRWNPKPPQDWLTTAARTGTRSC